MAENRECVAVGMRTTTHKRASLLPARQPLRAVKPYGSGRIAFDLGCYTYRNPRRSRFVVVDLRAHDRDETREPADVTSQRLRDRVRELRLRVSGAPGGSGGWEVMWLSWEVKLGGRRESSSSREARSEVQVPARSVSTS